MLVIVVGVVLGYEVYLRNRGFTVDYDDGPPLWSDKRAQVYGPTDQTIVFIGSSRIKYDLDRRTWKNLTKVKAVQLAMEGSCPRPVLTDLANDPNFKGKLVIDVTEGLFFNMAPPFMKTPTENIKYYYNRTPAQRASFELNKIAESKLVFLNQKFFSTNSRLEALQLKSRPGVFMMPTFPMEFQHNTFARQSFMSTRFVNDPDQCNQVKEIWALFAKMAQSAPPMPPQAFEGMFQSVKADIAKIKARGGQVVFVRTPSSGAYLQGEMMGFPRAKFWDRLVKETNCPGIHFMDYPAINHFDCPEFSHLKQADAALFTKEFYHLLSQQKGFAFLQNTNPKKG